MQIHPFVQEKAAREELRWNVAVAVAEMQKDHSIDIVRVHPQPVLNQTETETENVRKYDTCAIMDTW